MTNINKIKQQGCPECGASGDMLKPGGGCVTCM